jgi:hypothetical protein
MGDSGREVKSQSFGTALVLPGVALMGGNQDAQGVAASSSAAPTTTMLTNSTTSVSLRTASGSGRSGQRDERQTEIEEMIRAAHSRSGTQTSHVSAAAIPSSVGSISAPGASETVQTERLAPTLDTAVLRAQLMGRNHLSGPTNLMHALAGAPLADNAGVTASGLSTYQQAVLLTTRGSGLYHNRLLGRNLGATSRALLPSPGNLPLHAFLQAQRDNHSILQNLGVIPGQQGRPLTGASYPPSLLSQTANILLQQQQLQQASFVSDIARALASQQQNRNNQQREASSASEHNRIAEAKADDHSVRRGRANWPGSQHE